MTVKFKAVIIDNQNEKFTREVKEIDTSHLKDGNVLVKVDYSSLNYKDALILNDGGKIVRKFPFVPGIDFSGKVIKSEDGEICEVICTYDPESRGGDSPDGRKVKGTIQWVDAQKAIPCDIRLYDRLFSIPNPEETAEGEDFIQNLTKYQYCNRPAFAYS